jgi:phosphoglycolate phosphatase
MSKLPAVACLFDLDGTILDSRRCGVTAFVLALDEAYGWKDPLEGVLIAGRTDRRIFLDIVRKFRGRVPEGPDWMSEVESFQKLYLRHLEALLEGKKPILCPGFPEILDRVAAAAGMEPGLATGNFREGAELKLRAGGIDPARFAFGAFGSETESRPELIAVARDRAREVAGGPVVPVIIGDTPEDYKAARAVGGRCALVSTGPYDVDTLSKLEPEFMTRDFADPGPFLRWIAGLRRAV